MSILALLLAPKFAQQYGDTRAQAWRAALPALVIGNPVLSLVLTSAMARRFAQNDVVAKAADVPAKPDGSNPAIIPASAQLAQDIQNLLSQAGVPPLQKQFVPSFIGLSLLQVRQMAVVADLGLEVSGNTDGLVQMQCPLPGTDWDAGITAIQLRFA
jgi:hypothetical protein